MSLASQQDDTILPFRVEGCDVRGRMVRLSGVVDEILSNHGYPDGIATLLAHAVTLAALLGDALKFDGKLTVQAKGDGPVGTIVADYKTADGLRAGGALRGWADFDAEEYRKAVAGGIDAGREVQQLLGAGHFAFTIDRGEDMERYQGIVALEGATLAECAQKYFDESEQLPTAVKLSAEQSEQGWRAGGLMLQFLASSGPQIPRIDDDTGADDWRRCAVLMASARDDELISPSLGAEQLLYRLFHEDGVRVFDHDPLEVFCQCNRERISGLLDTFSREDIAEMVVGDSIEVTCRFCNKSYLFDAPADVPD